MTLLILTSTPIVRLGLAEGERIIAQQAFESGRDLAATLAEKIQEFVKKSPHPAPNSLHPLKRIVVHAGPPLPRLRGDGLGGHTSLRIGVTTANALAYGLDIPIVGVSGPADNLPELLDRARSTKPAPGGVVAPKYERPPAIGPLPGTRN